jgi:uncharacterized protein DUF5947
MSSFATLRSLARKPEAAEHCDLCGAGLRERHQHLIDPVSRKLTCSCDACSVLFFASGETKYKRVPRDARFLCDFRMSDGQWDSLMIPIGLAFFMEDSIQGKVSALYPSPAGAMESMLSLEAWTEIVVDNPVLADMESDVQALLVNRLDHQPEYYLAPIDKCYALVGLIRGNWRGLSGGTEVWQKIHEFFTGLKEGADA